MQVTELVLAGLTGVAGGAINALAGGGTLLTFPALIMLGIPPVAANVTNTVALCPGYFGGMIAQRTDLRGQGRRMWLYVPIGVAGGLLGGVVLVLTGEHAFSALVPYLIFGAAALLGFQETIKSWLGKHHAGGKAGAARRFGAVAAVTLAAVYGGYFGPGLSVILLAVLGLAIDETLTRLNALKQTIALGANVAAAAFFVFSGKVVWPVAGVLGLGALAGGALGGKIAGRVRPQTLRRLVIAIGLLAVSIYLVR